jgi:benzoyl-CoA-dihydrodiol lyase
MTSPTPVRFQITPAQYHHWSSSVAGDTATLTLNINEDQGIRPGYKLKLNSYDLGVDIELYDALNRIRFEQPQVKSVVITSGKPKMFCSGANIYMLGTSTHAWKVNFCKFTNETRNGMEDSSAFDGIKFLAAVNGACAGGGYEVALAADEIALIDDQSSAVSLPEVPLLGVLPGTGGLTRVIDKRKVRRDLADVFCTSMDGVRAPRAKEWKLVDHIAKPGVWQESVATWAKQLSTQSKRSAAAKGVALTPLKVSITDSGYTYDTVQVSIDNDLRAATITVHAPAADAAITAEAIQAQGDQWWALKMARELDDAILNLRSNHLEVGLWIFKTAGDAANMRRMDDALVALRSSSWLVNETVGMLRRTLSRIDVSSRSLYAVIDQSSCFHGTLAELALACDRTFMRNNLDAPDETTISLHAVNQTFYPMSNGLNRLANRYNSEAEANALPLNTPFNSEAAASNGLATSTPDELDWEDELRVAIEERVSMSPDALTGMEASLRFAGNESMVTRVFGRLSAWQNWIFIRPNAVGETGALKVYGKGTKAKFNWERV